MVVVSLLAPIRSGVYRHHCSLAAGLAARGHTLSWLCSGASHQRAITGEEADPESTDGEIVVPHSDSIGERTRAIVDRVTEISPAVVLCSATGDRVDLNAVRFLPPAIPRILVMHASSLASYRSARALRQHVCVAVAISPRIKEDLIHSYGFDDHTVRLIPNGIDITRLSTFTSSPCDNGPLRILSHGRIDASSKGVFWLPEILFYLNQRAQEWELTVSGDGPDLPELKRRFAAAGLASKVRFLGWTDPQYAAKVMSRHDVLLFPSRYEGFGIVLIEAMAAGCVPVASILPGITDWIIEDGVSGLLFPVGDVNRAAAHLFTLHHDRNRLESLRQQARKAAERFSAERMADQYIQLFHEVLSRPGEIRSAEPIEKCALARGLRPAWWFRLPEPVKNQLRGAREMVRAHIRIP